MNTETLVLQVEQTQEQIEAANKLAIIEQKFSDQEQQFVKLELAIATLRRFMVKHHDTLAPFRWKAYGWDTEIKFDTYNDAPKEIAKAFGSNGWTRKHDRFSCGSINWEKEVDGCKLIIECAENIKPKLIDEVKL